METVRYTVRRQEGNEERPWIVWDRVANAPFAMRKGGYADRMSAGWVAWRLNKRERGTWTKY